MNQDRIETAFDILTDEINICTGNIKARAMKAFQEESYVEVSMLAASAEKMNGIRKRISSIQADIIEICQELAISSECPSQYDRMSSTKQAQDSQFQDTERFVDLISDLASGKKPRSNPSGSNGEKAPRTNIRVIFPGGYIIYSNTAQQTLVEAIRYIGVEKVASLNLRENGFDLVSTERHPRYHQHPIGEYLIMSNTSTKTKKRLLDQMAQQLGIDMSVEITE